MFNDPISGWKFKVGYSVLIIAGILLAICFIGNKYLDYKAKKYCEKHHINIENIKNDDF